jgi:hypothetical protein
MLTVPTVQIVDPNRPEDFVVINASDFDPSQHRVFGAPEPAPDADPAIDAEPASEPAPEGAVSPDDLLATFVDTALAQKAADVYPTIATCDSLVVLDAMRAAEEAGKKRVSIVAAIAARRASLTPAV